MIPLEELKEQARIRGLSLGNAEKDYLISLALLSISRRTKNELVFKGGTALYKFYGLERFSEDADFSAVKAVDHRKLSEGIMSDMEAFGVDCVLKSVKQPHHSVLMVFRCKGPLYQGTPLSYSSVGVDINLRSSVDLEPENKHLSPLYQDIPAFSLLVMREEEILAEKIRALITRAKARDAYDIWFLIRKGIRPDNRLVEKKFAYYGHHWDVGMFEQRVASLEKVWEKELARLVSRMPPFGEVKKQIISESRKWKL